MPDLSPDLQAIQRAIILTGDLSALTDEQRVTWYLHTCEIHRLDPASQPFEYRTYEGKLMLCPNKAGCAQLRNLYKIKITQLVQTTVGGCVVFTATAETPDRMEMETGAADITDLSGKEIANAIMAATTKAKNRVTLALAGLGMLDESEITVRATTTALPAATPTLPVNTATAEVVEDTRPQERRETPRTDSVITKIEDVTHETLRQIERPAPGLAPGLASGLVTKVASAPKSGLFAQVAECVASALAPFAPPPPVAPEPETPVRAKTFDEDGLAQQWAATATNDMERAAAFDPDPPAIHTVQPITAPETAPVATQPQPAPENAAAHASAPAPAIINGVLGTVAEIKLNTETGPGVPGPATKAEFERFTSRAAKIIRDVLPKAGLRNGSDPVKAFFLKTSGCVGLKDISAAQWETMLTTLESGTPEQTVALIKGK